MMNAAAPEGTPPRRIDSETQYKKNSLAPPCLEEALRWGTLIIGYQFSWYGAFRADKKPVPPPQKKRNNPVLSRKCLLHDRVEDRNPLFWPVV